MRKKFLLMLLLALFCVGGAGLNAQVAKVGNTEYANIDEAIAAWTNNSTLTLMSNVTLSDVVKLKSTEHHTLDLGTFTLTAASGKHAIEITCEGRSSASYAITVNADATNPGGITATGKSCIYYSKSNSTKDRPIIRIYNGVFNGSYSINSKSNGNTNCPQIWIYGGTFNGNVNLTKNMLRVFGGVFNGWINCTGDSSAYREISGGRFKSWQFMTADANNKFWVGTSLANYDVGCYVDKDGYLCVGGPVITELSAQYPAKASNYSKWSSYLKYSSAATYGLFYKDVDMAIKKHGEANVEVYVPAVQINGEGYETLAKALAEVEDGETIQINGTIEEQNFKLPSTLKNVTIKAYSNNTRSVEVESGAVLKNMTITSADGNSVHYEGLTFDGITFDNSNVVLTGWRTDEVVYKNITVNNCIFKNIVRTSNEAAFHINCDVDEAVNGFTFTNNVIDGVSGASNSGVYAQLTGNVTFTGNVINNVAFRPYVIQLTTDDGVADTFIVEGNTFSGSKVGRAQGLGNNAEGTDAVALKVSNNIFEGITDSQQICYWNFNAAKTTADLSGNYYDIDILDNPGKIYYNSAAANTGDLAAMKVFPIYTALNEDGTIDEASAYTPVALAKIGDKNYYSLQSAINAVQNGETITLIADITENVTLTEKTGLYYTIDGDGKTMTGTITVSSLSDTNDNRRITINNINFKDTADANVDFISSVNTNHYPRLTIEGCIFTGSGNDGDVAVRLKSSHSVVIKGCTGTGLHSFLQNTSGWNLTIENVTVTDSKSGLALGTVQGVTVKGCNITADGYGIRMDAQYNNNAVIESNKVKAFIPVVVRKASVDSNITFNGTNEFTATNADGLWCAIGTSEYETDGQMPTAATGKVRVTLNDAALDVKGIYGYTLDGEGTAENPYLINNINDLIVFRNNVNAGNKYSGKYVKLTADIDLNNENWTPIGTSSNPFNGTFDGQNNTISNLVINGGSNSDQGFFGRTNDGEIKNVTFKNAKVSGRLNVGVVAGQPYTSKYTNVNVTGHVEVNGMAYVGGVGGKNAYADWTNIKVNVDGTSYVQANSVENGTAYRTYVGGVVGFNGEGSHTFKNISSNIKVKGSTKDIGGVFGIAHYNNKFENITFTGYVEAPEGAKEVGGIAGVWHNEEGTSVTFTNCTSTGTVKVGDVTTTGSIVGGAYNPDNKYEENSGSLIIEGEEAWLPRKVATKAELDAALAAAQDGDIIVMTADIDYGTAQLAIAKPITLDLGGKTLTTGNAYGGMSVKNNPTIKNGTIVHASNTAAIKVWNATAFEDLVIDVQGKGDANKTIGGIVLQSGSTTNVGSIKNVTIKGTALTNGIETYNCGDATANVIGSMEDVTIDANGTAMLISAPCGTATNCSFTGDVNAIEISIKGNYSASLNLVDCVVVGGVFAHDEFSSNPDIVNNGTLSFTADEATTGASVEDVTLTIARAEAEKVIGVLKDVMDNAKAKVNDTYYLTLTDAIAAAKAGDVVTVFAGTYAMPSMKAGITIVGEGEVVFNGTLSGTLENLTMKNIHIKGSDAQRWAYAKGDLVFDNVTFEATGVYALHFDGITAGATLLYKDCTIIGWAALGGSPASCIFEGCTIKGNGSYGVIRTYFNTTIKDCTFDVANVNTTDVYQDGIHAVSGATVTVNNCTNVNGDMKDIVYVADTSKVIVGEVVIKNTVSVTIGEKTNYYMTLAEAFAAIGEGAVVIELLDNATLNYGAREAYGTAETTSLTINGNGKVLTLNQTNSDWSSFGLANENAKVVFNNMKIEKTGKGDTSGAWNTHAIIFSSNVEMNNLIVNNAIAVQAGAILNNVAINEANGYYGLWINGNGQEVTMNGGSITATNGGRGIKIADQYIDNPAQVTLNVTGTVFTTAKKAAVLVSSKAGAEIAASKVNIENVAEDTVNFVWVDEDWAANFGNVEVTGATVAQEGKGSFVAAVEKDAKVQAYYKDLHAAMVAAKAGETVVLIKDVDLAGTEWEPVSFGGTFDGNGKTISNLTINKPGVSNTGFIKSLNGTVKNITFTSPTVKGGENTAVVAGRAGGSAALAENITINGTIKVETTHSGYARAAAIVGGWAYGNYKNITVDGGDKANSYIKHAGGGDGRYVAGIVGHADDVNSYVNCTVKNITISGGWLCGGIAGPGPADKLASNCSVENIDINADYSGGMFGWYYGAGTIENATIKNVTFTDGSTNNGVVGGYGHNTDATVTNLTFESVQNSNGAPLLDHVASIGNNHYFTLADAVNAATDGQTIELLWSEGKAPIAMNASLYGKSVTITGTATVDWSKGFLFVGRGGKGNATLIFDGAKLTSASNNASTGIHVSGREKETNNKYDGTVVIKNSTIDLDYLINKGAMTLDKATLTVKNGFAIGGRPASETESGADATATITLNNGSKVVVNNHNGMGLGYEAIGVMNINNGSTFECTQDFLVTAKGTMNVNGGIVTTKVKITNNGVINVSGESTLNIASFEGENINFLDGATIKGSNIGGGVFVAGNVTFDGDNTFNMIYDFGTLTDYYGTTAPMKWNVKEGASLTLTDKARYGLGYGDNVTIIGSIDNALTARENLTEIKRSLFMHGLVAQESKGWNCSSALNIENAYVVIGSNNSFGNKPGNYGGTYTFNIKNSVVDASRITFYEALSTSTFTFEGSDVKMGTFMTRDTDSKFILKNSKVLSTTTTNGNDEGNYNAGELTLVNSSLTYSATLSNTGVITVDATSTLTAPAISGDGKITIDAADFVIGSGDKHVVKANMNGFTGTINVVNNNYVTAEITEEGIVIKENNLEGEGTKANPYIVSSLTELELFRNKVNAGDNHAGKYVKLSADVNLSATRSANNWEPIGTTANPFKGTFDGDGYTISNLVVEGENYVGLFGYADNATIKNVTINNANVKGVECVGVIAGNVYSTSLIDNCHVKGNIKVEGQTSVGGIVGKYYTKVSNCSVIGDGVATSYVKGTYVKSDFEGDNIGGIMGHGGENNRFTGNTVKNITISGTRKVGGVVGVTDKATQVVNCVVENVNIETTATADYAASNKAKSGHGAIVGSYTTGGTAGLVADCVVKNVNFINEDNVTVSAGPITGGARGGSDSMLAPEGVTSSNNDIYMSTITGSNNEYLMNAVAKIGDVKYYALQDAFNAGGEVTVISDINLTEGVTVAAGKVVTLDLNGKDVSYTSSVAGEDMITNNGNLTIVDSKETGKIIYNNTDATGANVTVSTISTCPGSTLVVNGGTIKNNTIKADGSSIYSYAIDILTNGNLGDVNVTINGGTVYSDYMAIRQFNNGTACKNSLTINGGYIYGAKRAVQVHMDNNAAYTTIVNGKVEAGDYSLCFLTTSENISVLGGEFIGEVWYSGTNGFITGGTFTTDVNDYCAENFSAIPQGPTWVVKQVKGTQTRELASAGWYWFSSYIDIEGEEGLEDLQEALNGNGKEVRGQDGFTRYYSAYQSWTPGLKTVSTEEMYMINTTAPVTLILEGNFVAENRSITLNPGWNWIGYPVRVSVPVGDALANHKPEDGDMIKSINQNEFSQYYAGLGWWPSFNLQPGEGYKYDSKKSVTTNFVYSTTVTNSNVSSSKSNAVAEYHWTPAVSEYAENMVVIAMLDLNGEYADDSYEVAAFANGECRGSARPIYNEKLDKHMLFMTVYGDEVENVTFRCYDNNSDEEFEISNVIVYSNDAVLGSIREPYIMTCNTLGIDEATISNINIYPNPTTTDREINLQATCDKVEVFNTLGVKVAEYQNVDTIDALETAGTYVIRVTLNGDVKHCRLVVK